MNTTESKRYQKGSYKISWDKQTQKHNISKLWDKSSTKKEVHGDKYQHKKEKRSQINKLTLYLKELDKEEQTKPKISRKKEIISIAAEINETDNRKTNQKMKLRISFSHKQNQQNLTRLTNKK